MKKFLISACLCIISMFFLAACKGNSKPYEIDPFSNIKITSSGWDGEGKLKAKGNVEYSGNDETIQKLIDSISYKINPNKNLSNGDKVKITFAYDSDCFEICNVKFTKDSMTYIVKGLQDDSDRTISSEVISEINEETGEENESYKETITIDGVDIPVSWGLSEEEMADYVKYIQDSQNQNESEDSPEPVESSWIQGEAESNTKRKNANFYVKDYNNNDTDCYKAAYDYGITSSQKFMILPVSSDDGGTIGYKCKFKSE